MTNLEGKKAAEQDTLKSVGQDITNIIDGAVITAKNAVNLQSYLGSLKQGIKPEVIK